MVDQNLDQQEQVTAKFWKPFLCSVFAFIVVAAVLFGLVSITFEDIAFKKKAIAALLLMNLGVTIIIMLRFRFSGFVVMRVVIPVLSAIFGGILGGMSTALYSLFDQTPIGLFSGGIIGLLAGVNYCAIIANKCLEMQKESRSLFILQVGIVTGIVSSTLVHLVMMIAYEQYSPIGMGIGLPFGVIAGVVLGAIACILVARKLKPVDVKSSGSEFINSK